MTKPITVAEQNEILIDEATFTIGRVAVDFLTPGEHEHIMRIRELLRELGNSVSNDGAKL